MKKILDGKIIMGIGIGIVISTVLILPLYEKKISATEIESKARDLGMIYIDEIKALPDVEKGVRTND